MTYAQAKEHILQHLRSLGWEVKPHLKVPQAVTPNGSVVRFKAQAVYVGAHSLWVDIRQVTPAQFVEEVMNRERSRDPRRKKRSTAQRRNDKLMGRTKQRDPKGRARNREGLTWTEWLAAAGGSRGILHEMKLSRAWARGEDPSDYRAATQHGRRSNDPAGYRRKYRSKHGKARVQKNLRKHLRAPSARKKMRPSRHPEQDPSRHFYWVIYDQDHYYLWHSKDKAEALRSAKRMRKHGGCGTITVVRRKVRPSVASSWAHDPGKRRIVHGRAHHGERTQHHAPIRQEAEQVRYLLHWYSPEDRRTHITKWNGPANFAQAKREAEAYCDRSEAKRFMELRKNEGRPPFRDPARRAGQ